MRVVTKSQPAVNLNPKSRYNIHTAAAASRNITPVRLLLVRSDACFQCGMCVDACVYGVHHRQDDMRMPMGVVDQSENLCRSCLRCVRECPKEALSVPSNPEFREMEYGSWTSEIITTNLRQAESGKVPVSGAGYRGKFAGPGFDSIWTDMSEIVRPTRDGIHGREYISTSILIGARPSSVTQNFELQNPVCEIAIPILFDAAEIPVLHSSVYRTLIKSAENLMTLIFLRPDPMTAETSRNVIPVYRPDQIRNAIAWIQSHDDEDFPVIVELEDGDGLINAIHDLKQAGADLGSPLIFSLRIPFNADRILDFALQDISVFHLRSDRNGETSAGHVSKALREVHNRLVEAGIRDRVTLLYGGAVSAAEHVPKSVVCGADGVSLDLTLLNAIQVWRGAGERKEDFEHLAVIDCDWGVQRIKNLVAAWRDQLLEILGAMGMREVRRLRGETGRALFHDDLLSEFRSVFGNPTEFDLQPRIELPPSNIARIDAPAIPMQRNFHNELSKFRVQITSDCIHCTVCVSTCPYGVFEMPNGMNKLLPPKSSQCIGSSCEDKEFYCIPKCPVDAIKIDQDETFRAMGDPRWTADLLVSTFKQAETGVLPETALESEVGKSEGGFDCISIRTNGHRKGASLPDEYRTAIPLNRRKEGKDLWIPVPWYGGGMSYGSISLNVMIARAKAAQAFGTFMSTGEGGYPDALIPYSDHVITQVATGLFGVHESTIRRAPVVEFKYAQGAKPGLGGHLLADKVTADVARMRGSMQWSSLFSPFPFHSVYSVEDHKKHLDWIRIIHPEALISVKVSTPGDVDMVAVGSYYAGANILQLDGSYGGTGAAPDIAKKNIAMPIEFAIPKVHRFLINEGVRDEMVILASGGVRTPADIIKAIALGADGVVVGTAELVAIECDRCTNCERGRGCPFGIATSDPELTDLINPDWAAQRIINLFHSWRSQILMYLDKLGLESVRDLRGRTDLIEYAE
jgi:glutamate synthase domain-containing protein 2/ferredoxin